MKTKVGEYLRKIRMEHGELLRDMAKNLDVSSSFLSAVENGKKKVPDTWPMKLKEIYDLDQLQLEELQYSILESGKVIELNVENVPSENRELAVSFARRFSSLDEKEARRLLSVLNDEKGDR